MNQNTENIEELLGPENFLIDDRRFLDPINQGFDEIEAEAKAKGQVIIPTCCKDTAKLLRRATEFGLTMADFEIFLAGLIKHPYQDLKKYKDLDERSKIEAYVEDVFSLAECLDRPELRNYFLDSVLGELKEQIYGFAPNVYTRIERGLAKKVQALDLEGQNAMERNSNPDFTLHRQVLAIYYLFEYNKVTKQNTNVTDMARFTQFLTGREGNTSKIQNTGIYKEWGMVLGKNEKRNQQDLEFVKGRFLKLGMSEIVRMIENDMDGMES